MEKLTAKEVQNKYAGKYIDVYECPSWNTNKDGERLYEVRGVFSEIHENTTLGEDVGTGKAYTR